MATKDAARVIRDITNTPFFVPEGKGEINACKAVQDMIYEREELAEIRTLVKQIQKALACYDEGVCSYLSGFSAFFFFGAIL